MSTFAYESTSLLSAGHYGRVMLYVSASVIGSIAMVILGAAAAQRLG
jgi:fluoride ion exporter CrcB/FEX